MYTDFQTNVNKSQKISHNKRRFFIGFGVITNEIVATIVMTNLC